MYMETKKSKLEKLNRKHTYRKQNSLHTMHIFKSSTEFLPHRNTTFRIHAADTNSPDGAMASNSDN